MDFIYGLIFFLSSIALFVLFIMLLVKLITKKGRRKKTIFIGMGIAVVLMIVSLVLAPPLTAEQKAEIEQRKELKQKEKDEKLKLEEEQKKQEEEKAKKEKEEKEKEQKLKDQKEKEEAEKKEQAKKEKQELAKKKKEQEEKKKLEDEKKKAKKDKEEKERLNKEKAEKKKKEEKPKKKKSIESIIAEEHSKIDSVTLDDGYLKLEIDGDGSFSVNTLFNYPANDAFDAMETAFKDKKVDTVGAIVKVTMMDAKGNESKDDVISIYYDRENFEEFDLNNFKKISLAEPWRIYNESNSYYIHPGIYKDLKDKITSNLINGSSKVDFSD